MKETLGGTLTIWLFLFFFVIYVTFIGVALQFAKIYRVKNYVINTLEQQQYVSGEDDNRVFPILDNYLDGVPYNTVDKINNNYCQENYGEGAISHHSVCIIPKGDESSRYYKVVVFFVAEFPFLDINMTIPASGETKVIKVY